MMRADHDDEWEQVGVAWFAAMREGDFAAAWSTLLRDGFAPHVPLRDKPATFNGNAAGGIAHTLWSSAPAPTPDSPEVVLVRSYSIDDGRYITGASIAVDGGFGA